MTTTADQKGQIRQLSLEHAPMETSELGVKSKWANMPAPAVQAPPAVGKARPSRREPSPALDWTGLDSASQAQRQRVSVIHERSQRPRLMWGQMGRIERSPKRLTRIPSGRGANDCGRARRQCRVSAVRGIGVPGLTQTRDFPFLRRTVFVLTSASLAVGSAIRILRH